MASSDTFISLMLQRYVMSSNCTFDYTLNSCKIEVFRNRGDIDYHFAGLAVVTVHASLFVFCNRRKDKIKILEWDNLMSIPIMIKYGV